VEHGELLIIDAARADLTPAVEDRHLDAVNGAVERFGEEALLLVALQGGGLGRGGGRLVGVERRGERGPGVGGGAQRGADAFGQALALVRLRHLHGARIGGGEACAPLGVEQLDDAVLGAVDGGGGAAGGAGGGKRGDEGALHVGGPAADARAARHRLEIEQVAEMGEGRFAGMAGGAAAVAEDRHGVGLAHVPEHTRNNGL
jgi:hypothetical protein